MADIKNELSWSRTRTSTLHACKRRYYYQYYLKWDGWRRQAPAERQLAYRLSKMTNLNMLAGLAVHETIRRVLTEIAETGSVQLSDPAMYARRDILTRVWRDAERQRWKSSPKRSPPVFELYYDRPISPGLLKEVGAKTQQCIEAFLNSDLYAALRSDDPQHWLAIDPDIGDSQKLTLHGHTVWAIPDFARRTPHGGCEIWDWKTGRHNPEDRVQLLSYALYARDCWNFSPDEIQVYGMYLSPDHQGPRVQHYPCNAEVLASIEATIADDVQVMQQLLSDVPNNTPLGRDAFEQQEPGRTCEYCRFKELCDR